MNQLRLLHCLILILGINSTQGWAVSFDDQDKTIETDSNQMELNLLLPPSSPGFTLLNKEFSSVDRPGTVADLAVLFQTKTENFSTIPEDYALEFSPYWIIWGEKTSYDEYRNNKIWNNMLQSFTISIASATDPDPLDASEKTRSMGFGFKLSLFRGEMQNSWNDLIKPLQEYHRQFVSELREKENSDKILSNLRAQLRGAVHDPIKTEALIKKMEAREKKIEDELRAKLENSSEVQIAKKKLSEITLKRVGFKMDVAGGVAVSFPGESFDNASIKREGIWTTFGYEWNTVSVLAVARYYHDRSENQQSNYDFGARLIWDHDRLSLSGEGVIRFLGENKTDPSTSWRLAMIVSYNLGANKSLQFVFGRDNKGEKTGNLISLVNFVIGLGTQRPIY